MTEPAGPHWGTRVGFATVHTLADGQVPLTIVGVVIGSFVVAVVVIAVGSARGRASRR